MFAFGFVAFDVGGAAHGLDLDDVGCDKEGEWGGGREVVCEVVGRGRGGSGGGVMCLVVCVW